MSTEEIEKMRKILNDFCNQVERGKIIRTAEYEDACRLLGRIPVDKDQLVQSRLPHILQGI